MHVSIVQRHHPSWHVSLPADPLTKGRQALTIVLALAIPLVIMAERRINLLSDSLLGRKLTASQVGLSNNSGYSHSDTSRARKRHTHDGLAVESCFNQPGLKFDFQDGGR